MNLGSYATVSGLVFTVIAVLQAARAAKGMPVQIGTKAIPVWISWIAAVVAGALALWAFRTLS
jgi:hypothetical protein